MRTAASAATSTRVPSHRTPTRPPCRQAQLARTRLRPRNRPRPDSHTGRPIRPTPAKPTRMPRRFRPVCRNPQPQVKSARLSCARLGPVPSGQFVRRCEIAAVLRGYPLVRGVIGIFVMIFGLKVNRFPRPG